MDLKLGTLSQVHRVSPYITTGHLGGECSSQRTREMKKYNEGMAQAYWEREWAMS